MTVAALVLAMAGCSSGGASGSEGAAANASVANLKVTVPQVDLPKPEKTDVVIATSAVDPYDFVLELAAREGLYKKYGLNVTTKTLAGGQPTLQAMLAGQVDVSMNTAFQTITSLATDRPLVDVGIMTNKLPLYLYGGKGIHSAADLRGKKVAISQPGGLSDAEATAGLAAMGLSRDDVQFTQVGGQNERAAALLAGTVAAAPADPAIEKQITSGGGSVLVKLPETDQTYATSSIELQRSFVEKNPNTTLAVVAAALVAQESMLTDTPYVIDQYADWAKVSHDDAQKTIQGYLDLHIMQRDFRSTTKAYENVLKILQPTNPKLANVDVKDAYDPQFLDQLEKLGFYDKLGIPAS